MICLYDGKGICYCGPSVYHLRDCPSTCSWHSVKLNGVAVKSSTLTQAQLRQAEAQARAAGQQGPHGAPGGSDGNG